MKLHTIFTVLVLFAVCNGVFAVDNEEAVPETVSTNPELVVYKTVETEKGEFEIKLHFFHPETSTDANRACILLYHGGGWNNGAPTRVYSAARRWAARGLVAIAVEYRVRDIHGGNALDSVRDAKSAMRWVRTRADELQIDPNRIAAGGTSAGGHLAMACATLTAFDEPGEDNTVSCVPDALVLLSPVLDNGPDGGYGHHKREVRENWQDFSPFHNIRKGVPPTLISFGTEEARYLRVEIAEELKQKMEALGGRCELVILEGATHTQRTSEQRARINRKELAFLQSLGYLGER